MTEVLWREWGDDAFAEARRLDKPILLDIGAVWCHWCHVMDHGIPGDPVHTGTYSDPAVIEIINREYVPIKVDNDRRPDINARYNMGGWPTTAFLTPDGDPLYGATYLTPSQLIGLLESIANYYRENKQDITAKIEQHAAKQRLEPASAPAGQLAPEIGDFVSGEIKRNFDKVFGGFGMQPKFPHPSALSFAIMRYATTGDEDLKRIAEKTLIEMSSGGMYDQFAGGFFRYSTTRDWSIPHYEKMLEDNSRLLTTSIFASQVFGDSYYKDVALDVKRFLMDVLYEPVNGTFAGSQDADKEEEYYGRPLTERELMPTPYIDWTVYADWNALVVTALTDLYKLFGDVDALNTAVKLYDFLAQRVVPYHFFRDGKGQGPQHLLSDIAALVGASLDLFEATGHRRYLSEARGLADIAIVELFDEEAQQFRDIPASENALGALSIPRFDQEDNAQLARQLLRLSASSGSSRYQGLAESTLTSLAAEYRQQSYFASAFAVAVETVLSAPVHIVLVGDLNSPEMERLKLAAFRHYAVNKTVELRSAEDGGEYLPDAEGRPVAYVCKGVTCSAPISDPLELGKMRFVG